ncbi:protein TAPETUM DETERMINANT 1-like [Telopea speciosissima]|uniref:protein TAPETUM DETERMINANT 1-like n=1 Tax=Telopea speciosissima TaxID=54955 RepID=UPI001CC56118|nr:protein TAPETUM DETERMINANT 1-like [Telopea speciosissima]
MESVLKSIGFCKCSIQSLKLIQIPTGKVVQGKSEFAVSVLNECSCKQGNIKVNCSGFQTTEVINPLLFKNDECDRKKCVLLNGLPIGIHESIDFVYAWDTQFPFSVVYAEKAC